MPKKIIQRIQKYALKRTYVINKAKMWKTSSYPYEHSGYDQGFVDAMTQIAEFCEWLEQGQPDDFINKEETKNGLKR